MLAATYSLIFLFGIIIGSFLNVLILRIPNGEDFISKRSHCPKCGGLIPWYHNIPLLSFLILRGECHRCNQKISLQYPLVELLTGIIAVLVFAFKSNFSTNGLYYFMFYFSTLAVFLCHVIIDFRHRILPNILTGYLALLFFVDRLVFGSWTYSLIGGAIGFLFPLLITYIFFKVKGVVGLGGGDIKLYGALGLILGPLSVVHTIFLSCLIGSIVSIVLIVIGKIDRKTPIPFGPFIVLVGTIQILFPNVVERLIS